MATTIITKNGSGAPLAGDLTAGELAVDLTNKRLYSKDSGGTVIELGTNAGSSTFADLTVTGDLTVDTNTLYVDSTNNRVGIGVTPSYELDIGGASTQRIRLNRTSETDVRLEAYALATGAVLGTYSASPLAFYTDGSPRITIGSTGNVGIGASTIDTALHIERPNPVIQLEDSTNGFIAQIDGENGALAFKADIADASGSATNITFDIDGSERMRIDSSGNVGIGESNPDTPLHITNAAANQIKLQVDSTTVGPNIVFANNDGNLARIASAETNTLRFEVGPSNTEAMRINSSGSFLVGTTVNSGRVSIQGQNSTSANNALHVRNSSATTLCAIRNDGVFQTGTATNSPYNLTTANSANVWVNASGTLFRSTSSARYKENIRDYDQTASVDSLRPVFFNSKNEDDNKTYAGLIAEEVHDAGFTEFVEYNGAGEPDSVFYASMVALCIKEIQDLKAEVAALKGAS